MATVALGVLALDQASKAIVNAALERGEETSLAFGFELVHVRNEGIAFGLFDDGGALLVAVTALTLVLFVAWFASQPSRPWLWLGVGLLAGGALGNLVDRIRGGGVTDFLDPPAWPAFNIADAAITGGVVVLILTAFASDDGDATPEAKAPPDGDPAPSGVDDPGR